MPKEKLIRQLVC